MLYSSFLWFDDSNKFNVRIKMVKMRFLVSLLMLNSLQVSLKHSGSLFMYAGHKGGAYAKNSFGNMYAYDCIHFFGPLFSSFVLGNIINAICASFFFLFVFKLLIKSILCSYTAVGVFVLGRMLREAWGSQASRKQAEFNDYLEVI